MSQNPTAREAIEERETRFLSEFARPALASRGRAKPLPDCPYRTCFQRDRDRIIHSKAFRRLMHKTQVFLAPEGDHYRTRLTHTIEVSQISRTIARALALNEDLTEAVALGHDLGHTPFGHVGEEALRATDKLKTPFKHNEQSLRVVDHIEYEGGGLNLTHEVRDGILNHTGEHLPETLEARIVRIADRIAYINHDIEDAVRAGVISADELPTAPIKYFGHHGSLRISAMVQEMITNSLGEPEISMSDKGWRLMNELRDFLFARVYTDSEAKKEDAKAGLVLTSLFNHFHAHPEKLPPEFQPGPDDDIAVRVVDYIAGMTDRFAIRTFQSLFVPKSWMV